MADAEGIRLLPPEQQAQGMGAKAAKDRIKSRFAPELLTEYQTKKIKYKGPEIEKGDPTQYHGVRHVDPFSKLILICSVNCRTSRSRTTGCLLVLAATLIFVFSPTVES